MEVEVILKDILKDKDYPEGGCALCDIAEDAISNDNRVILNMVELDSIPTNFMNTSFGALIEKYGIATTKNLFIFNNIKKSQFERIKKYFEDSELLMKKNSKSS